MSAVIGLPRQMRDAVIKEFQGERILWTGQPNVRRSFFTSLLIWLFAIPWTAFSVGWEWVALGAFLEGSEPRTTMDSVFRIVFPLFGAPFVLVGFGMLAAPFYAGWRALRTIYIVGEKRISTMTLGRSLSVTSYPMDRITRVERIERRDGSGTLKLVMGSHRDSDGDRVETTETLIGIPDVHKVERLVLSHAPAGR